MADAVWTTDEILEEVTRWQISPEAEATARIEFGRWLAENNREVAARQREIDAGFAEKHAGRDARWETTEDYDRGWFRCARLIAGEIRAEGGPAFPGSAGAEPAATQNPLPEHLDHPDGEVWAACRRCWLEAQNGDPK